MTTLEDLSAELKAHSSDLKAHMLDTSTAFQSLKHDVRKLKMADGTKNIFNTEAANPAALLPLMAQGTGGMGGIGAVGGAAVGSILASTLLGRRGLGGENDGGNFVTPAQLTSALNGVTDSINATTNLQTLGDIKGAIPLAEGQVQLALAGAQTDLNRNISGVQDSLGAQINAGQIANATGQAALSRQLSDVIATSLASQSTIKDTVQDTSAATNLAIANLATAGLQNTYALNTAIRDEGDKTRAVTVEQNERTRSLITQYHDHDLQRQLTEANLALAEQRAEGRARATEINVTQSVTQNQNQLNLQNQQQQQMQIMAQLAATVNALQHATAANTQIIAGNSGNVRGGGQTATPTNVSL